MTTDKYYNTQRKKLALAEYGRNIQVMVDYLFTIEDRDKRNKSAQAVIDVMGNLNPHLRDVAEYKHKLWDHLAIMADFKLDIDYPYNPPTPDILTEKPNIVPYPQKEIQYKHYGYTMELLINKISEMHGEEREILIEQLANQMKKLYLAWNKESVEDEKIFADLYELSGGQVSISSGSFQLTETKAIIGKTNIIKKKKHKKK